MIFPPEYLLRVLLVGWRKAGKMLSWRARQAFSARRPFPGKCGWQGKGARVAGRGQCLSGRRSGGFVSSVGSGWEMHTQQGKGEGDWRQFSKNNTAQASGVPPRSARRGTDGSTRSRERAGPRGSHREGGGRP